MHHVFFEPSNKLNVCNKIELYTSKYTNKYFHHQLSQVWAVKIGSGHIYFVYTEIGLLTYAPHVALIFCQILQNPHFANLDHWAAPSSPAINQCYHLVQPPETRESELSELSEVTCSCCSTAINSYSFKEISILFVYFCF